MKFDFDLEAQFFRQGVPEESEEIFKDGKVRKRNTRRVEVILTRLAELIFKAQELAEMSHTLVVAYNPKELKLGFLDETTNTLYSLRIANIHKYKSEGFASEEQYQAARELLKTIEGRVLLFSHN